MQASDRGWTSDLSRPTSRARMASTYRSTNACCSGVNGVLPAGWAFWASASPRPYSRYVTSSSDSRRITPIIADGAPALGTSVSGPLGDEDGHGEAIANQRAVPTRCDAEAVVGQRRGEQLTDPVGVTGLGERAADQALELAFESIMSHARLRQSDIPEESFQLTPRQRADVGRIPQALHGVEGVGLLRRRRAVRDDDLPAHRTHPAHLGQDRARVEEVMEGEAGADDRERAVRPGQRQDVALTPGEVGEASLLLEGAGTIEHGGRDVDTRHLTGDTREGAGEQARAARHVEHGVAGAGAAPVDDELERRLVLDGRRRGERDRLARELVEDQVRVFACRHGHLS